MYRTLFSLLIAAVLIAPSFSAEEEFTSKVIQIGMIVSDLDASVKFYTEVVGLTEQAGFEVDADFGKRSGLTDSLPIKVRVLKVGAGEDATQLKLMTFGDKAKKQTNEFIHTHTGIQYITINVKELAPIVERIKKHKVKFLGETPIPLGKRHFVMVKDPDGTFVELIGPMTEQKRFDSVFE